MDIEARNQPHSGLASMDDGLSNKHPGKVLSTVVLGFWLAVDGRPRFTLVALHSEGV